jgi:predicted nucleic acid-binding protein
MLVLDSDHLRVLRTRGVASQQLERRLVADGRQVVTTIVNVHEGLKGYLDEINTARQAQQRVSHYANLQSLLEYYVDWHVLPFDAAAATIYDRLKPIIRHRIQRMDLQIASIVLSRNATLLTADAHFDPVPDLKHERWI